MRKARGLMFKLTLRGVVPIEELAFEKRESKKTESFAEEFMLDGSDYWAIYIAAMQTIMPIVLFFAGAYFLAILFITKVWLA